MSTFNVSAHNIYMLSILFWKLLLNSTALNTKTKEHLLEKVSVLIKLYQFANTHKDSIYIKYITDNVVSIAKKIDLNEEGFTIPLTNWYGAIIDRETVEMLLTEYNNKSETEFITDSIKDYMRSGDTYFFSISHFPFAEKIDRNGLLELIEDLLRRISIGLNENYMN